MVNFLKTRLQVFVSSTFLDLKKERQAAVSAILNAGHIPAGMELFTAGDQSQMDVIKQWIDESDVYLLILGSRYGSIEPETGKSYTHLEYEYAVYKDKPLFACVIKDSAIDNRVKELGRSCLEQKNPNELQEFKTTVLSKMSGLWSDTKDIELEIMKALQTFSRREDLIGWVKGNESVNTVALTDELARLSKENADLREENNKLKIERENLSSNSISGISYEEMKSTLENIPVTSDEFDSLHSLNITIKDNWNIQLKNLLDFIKLTKDDLLAECLIVSPYYLQNSINKFCQRNSLTILKEKGIVDFTVETITIQPSEFRSGSTQRKYRFKLTQQGFNFLNWLNTKNSNENPHKLLP
ncbi:MAG: DUF4062 domain-containing protein [Cyanobacteria bacterium P01_G01_bin.19]